MVTCPNHIEIYDTSHCVGCGHILPESTKDYDTCQVFNIPLISIKVTEHRRLKKTCLHCGMPNKGVFPKQITAKTQYDTALKSLCVYLQNYHMLPYARCKEFIVFSSYFGYGCDHSLCNAHILRDLRMIKVKQKVSGCFRGQTHAQYFACIRGYITTLKKNNQNVLENIQNAFLKNPFLPVTTE